MNMNGKPLGTLQVDVDELWVYYESIGRPVPPDAPSLVYQQGIPRLLDLFDRYAIRATFFVCGRDLPAQTGALREMIVARPRGRQPFGYAPQRLSRASAPSRNRPISPQRVRSSQTRPVSRR